jgi:hypothetical protein
VVLLANFSAPSIASVPELTKYVVSKGAGSNEAKSLQYSTAGLCGIRRKPLHENIYLVDP